MGTAKSTEGVLAGECYKQAKEEGCHVDTIWQDGDFSSAKSVTEHHSNRKVYKCGGHVGRAHTNNLKEAAKKKEVSNDIAQKFKDKFPKIKTLKCKSKRHNSGCGCLSETFIKGAHINHFCILQQCKALKIMQSVCVLFPSITAETFIPEMKGHVGSTLNVPAVVINLMRVKAKSTTPRSP